MRYFPSSGMPKHPVIIFLVYSYLAGIVLGDHLGIAHATPRARVSITRGIVPSGVDNTDCNFAGSVVLGGFFSLESDDKFFTIGSHQLTAYNLVLDQINRYQCGVTLKEMGPDEMWVERNYALELRIYDDQSSTEGSTAVAKMLANDTSVDIMVGGYSSTLTQPFAEAAYNNSEKLVLAAGASSTKVYAGKDLAFGLLPPSTKYLSLAIEALATKHGAKTLATVWEDTSFTRVACGSAPDLADQYGMTMTSATEVVKTPNATALEPTAQSLKEEDPDVVITCVYDCNPWIQAMRRANWSPKAQVFTICVGQENFASQAGSDTAYIMGVTPWDSSLQIKDAVTGWSASEFASRFRSASKEDETSDVPYQAAMAASLISMVHQTIEGVNGFRENGPQLAEYVSKNSFQTMGGNLAFDENGQLKAPSLTIQYNKDGVVQTVYPPEAASGPMLYPMPTWDHRDCINLSGCQGNSTEIISATGNYPEIFPASSNTCDTRGMCVCSDPLNFKSVGSGATANCIQLEEMNYINRPLKVVSWVLTGLLLAFCAYCLGWTYYYRENSLVKVSQPLFLAFVVIGSILSILSMLTMGVEASYREDTEDIRVVDAACMATPWLWGLGFAVTYSALFAKVWRVHKLCKLSAKMRRQAVDYKDVCYIIVVVLAAEMLVLISYQVVSPMVWEREVVQDIDGYAIESIGRCQAERSSCFHTLLVSLNVVLLFIALVLCWRTKDLPSDFSESNYIFLAVMFMFQIFVMTVPVNTMVKDDSNVYFFTRMAAVFLQNFSVLMLIFLPKMRRIFIGEDTETSIKNATIDMSRRESNIARSGKYYAGSICSHDKSLDSMDLADTDSVLDDSFSRRRYGYRRNSSVVEDYSTTNKTTESNDNDTCNDNDNDEELGKKTKDDYRVHISEDDRPVFNKKVSWRYEAASSADSASRDSGSQ